jgi:rRNA maturation endonuclease Nob1
MADPKAEKIEKKLDEAVASKQDGELSETDAEKVSGGTNLDPYKN